MNIVSILELKSFSSFFYFAIKVLEKGLELFSVYFRTKVKKAILEDKFLKILELKVLILVFLELKL